MDDYEPDEEEFLYDGRRITVLRGQHPGSFYGAHAFFLAQSYAFRAASSILEDEHGFPMLGLIHTPRGEEHKHEPLVAQIEWVVTRVLRGLITRAIRITKEPLRIALTGFGPFEDQQGVPVPHNVTSEFAAAPERLRGALLGALPDILAPKPTGLELPQPIGPDDVVVGTQIYDPHYAYSRPIHLLSRVLSVDEHALSNDPASGLVGLLETFSPHLYLALAVRPRGAPEFLIEEVSDNSGLALLPTPHHNPELSPTTGHPLNRAFARAFTRGVQELGGYRNDET